MLDNINLWDQTSFQWQIKESETGRHLSLHMPLFLTYLVLWILQMQNLFKIFWSQIEFVLFGQALNLKISTQDSVSEFVYIPQ